MQCSKLVKNRKKNSFFLFIHLRFWTDLNGCQQRLLYAQQLTQRKCSLCLQGNSVNTLNGENVHHVTKLIINVTKVTLKSNCTMYNLYLFSFQTYHKNKLTASISFVSRMFPKVRSRWIMPWEWRYKTPLTTWVMMWRATKRRKVSPVTKIKIILNNNDKINIHLNRNHHLPRLTFEP